MGNEYKTISCKIDGKQSVSIPIDIKKGGRYVTEPLTVVVRGFLKFRDQSSTTETETLNQLEDKTVVYPVLFTSDSIPVNSGRCVITILPRSEDLFEETSSIEEATVANINIVSQGGIRTDEQITDTNKEPVVIKIEAGVIRSPYKLSIEVTVYSLNGSSFYNRTVDRGTSPQEEEVNDVTSLFQKTKKRTNSNIIIDCYNDSEWVPSVSSVLGTNTSSSSTIIDEINKLQNFTPFGASTMYDAIVVASRVLSDNDVDDKRKTIYLFTDNESNVSISSLDNAITEVNDIDGDKNVPVLISNMAIVEPVTLSVKANSSDTKNINKLSFLTGGQALTVNDEAYLDDIIGIFYRETVGSLGYGTYEFIADLGEEALINHIAISFTIPSSDSNATWAIETSVDGYNFTAIDANYTYADAVDFENLLARYIKFKIVLITSINDNVSDATPDSPALTSVQITYNAYKVAYLYLNKEEVDVQPYQITLAVDANEINDHQIDVGVAKSDSHNWNDYSLDSQPAVNQNGKVVIPIRFSQDIAEFQQEPLAKVDLFTLKTEYGSWDPFSAVLLYNKSDEVVPTNYYRLYPRDGIVVLNYALSSDYQDGDYKIGIINAGEYKIGMKLTNKTKLDELEIYGIGYLYTTGKDLLPPLAKAAPEAQSVAIENETSNRFSTIESSYVYYDSNFEEEDISQRRIRWFINGSVINYLENLTKWNDIADPMDPIYVNTSLSYPDDLTNIQDIETWIKKQSDSILNSGDRIYFEIQVSDGELYSSRVKSNMAEVVESTPVLDQITVMSDNEGQITSRLAGDLKAIIYPPIDTVFFSDGQENQSEIIWYVNDEVFKRGIYGEDRGVGQAPIHEIWPNEVGTESYRDYGLRMLNSIFVQVIPKTGNVVGDIITSPVVVVQNALPTVSNVSYIRNVHDEHNDVILTWYFLDFEVNFIGDVDESGQFDQTEIRWYRKNPGETEWPADPVYIFNDHDGNLLTTYNVEDYRGHITTSLGTHTSTIDNSIVLVGQQYRAEVLPHDSLDFGTTITTPIITITSATNN